MNIGREAKSVQTGGRRADMRPVKAARIVAGLAGLLGAALLAVSSACSLPEARPDLTRYYVLTPTAAKTDEAAPAERPRVFIRAVTVPEFLRGRIMQVRVSENELRYVDEARWAEPLDAGVLRVIRDNLDRSATVHLVDRGGDAHDYEVSVQLRRCEGVLPGGAARMTARVDVFTTELDPKLVAREEFTSEIPGWDGSDHAELAKKLSEAAAALTERIASLIPAAK